MRFALASAPELSESDGIVARDIISELCPVGSRVLVDEDDLQTEGSYERILGVVYCNGMNLNEEILKSGFGYVMTEFCSDSEFAGTSWAQKHGC